MKTYCGADCEKCGLNNRCNGCASSGGCPFGKPCLVAEHIKLGGIEAIKGLKQTLINEINEIKPEAMGEVKELFALCGSYVNLEYELPSGKKVKFLDDNKIYLGAQIEAIFSEKGAERCYGVVADTTFILICEYGENGTNPELLLYKKR